MTHGRPLTAMITAAALLASGAPALAQGAGDTQYSSPNKSSNLRSLKAVGGKGRITLTVRLKRGATVRITVYRGRTKAGSIVFSTSKRTNVRVITRLRGKAIRKGTYRIRVSASGTDATVSGRVR